MTTQQTSEPFDESPVNPDRIAPFVSDLTRSGQEMVTKMSNILNDIQFQRAMQLGYMMACEDFGLPVPEFDDPAETTIFKA
jgi:hypothetical protein